MLAEVKAPSVRLAGPENSLDQLLESARDARETRGRARYGGMVGLAAADSQLLLPVPIRLGYTRSLREPRLNGVLHGGVQVESSMKEAKDHDPSNLGLAGYAKLLCSAR